jgi:hypothetical protein
MPNDFVRDTGLKKLEPVAKGVPLPDDRVSHHRPERKRKVQFHNLTHGNFYCEHGSKTGFANVHGTALQSTARPGIDTDINLKLEPRLATSVDTTEGDGCGWFLNFQSDPLRKQTLLQW